MYQLARCVRRTLAAHPHRQGNSKVVYELTLYQSTLWEGLADNSVLES